MHLSMTKERPDNKRIHEKSLVVFENDDFSRAEGP